MTQLLSLQLMKTTTSLCGYSTSTATLPVLPPVDDSNGWPSPLSARKCCHSSKGHHRSKWDGSSTRHNNSMTRQQHDTTAARHDSSNCNQQLTWQHQATRQQQWQQNQQTIIKQWAASAKHGKENTRCQTCISWHSAESLLSGKAMDNQLCHHNLDIQDDNQVQRSACPWGLCRRWQS